MNDLIGRKILITGGSGFLGSFIVKGLMAMECCTLGRESCNDFICNLTEGLPNFGCEKFRAVIHCAGKAHSLPNSREEAQEFFDVNVGGTKNLINSLTNIIPDSFVFISSISVYGVETGLNIKESYSLNGNSPYALSKIMAENLIFEWGEKYNVPILILRLPLVIGSNPPGNLGKMISGIKKGRYFNIGRGKARRSMVLAEDVAQFVIENIGKSGIYNLTDGEHPSFVEISSVISKQLNKTKPMSIPFWLAKLLGLLGDFLPFIPVNSSIIKKMTNDLTFSDSKARQELGWSPRKVKSFLQI